MSKTIIFTGGHHNSALLVAKRLKQEGYRIIWLGHRHASALDQNISQEYRDVMAADISFVNLRAGKMYRGNAWQGIKTILSFFFCIGLFLREQPKLIVSFGGYLSVPPVLAGWFLRIPSISHEQTTVLGMANKTILPFVKSMYLTWPIEEYAKSKKVKVIGLPKVSKPHKIRGKSDLNGYLQKLNPPFTFLTPDKPLLLVSGGKQGSHALNVLIEKSLSYLLNEWNIIHQTGSSLATKDYQRLLKKRQRLPAELQSSYVIIDYSPDFTDLLAVADMVVGRSGAHTVMEVLSEGKKMVAIPLPFSYQNEQLKNAQQLEAASLAVVLRQEKANPQRLVELVDRLKNTKTDQEKLQRVRDIVPINALDTLVSDISSIVK